VTSPIDDVVAMETETKQDDAVVSERCNNVNHAATSSPASPPESTAGASALSSSSSSSSSVDSYDNIAVMRSVPADADCQFHFSSRIAFDRETGQQLTVINRFPTEREQTYNLRRRARGSKTPLAKTQSLNRISLLRLCINMVIKFL